MAVTSVDVAREAGVSRATVSYTLNGKGKLFSSKTQSAVYQAAEKLGYRPVAAAQTLVKGVSNIVLMIPPLSPNAEFMSLMSRLAKEYSAQSKTLLMVPPDISDKDLSYTLQSTRPYILFSGRNLTSTQRKILSNAGTSFVDMAAEMSKPKGMNWQIGQMQARHLKARGFTHLVYARLSTVENDLMLQTRQEGFIAECRKEHAEKPDVIDIDPYADADLDIFSSLKPHSGIGCYNDDTAAAILGAGHLLGLSVPKDFGIIGVDNTSVSLQTDPQLTTIDTAFDIAAVVRYFGNQNSDTSLAEELKTQLTIIARSTT
ncbi:MAG: LacI family DNA-binding transcriptional regulator [Bifidobacterium sp.]|nr:LacI family DNA-binding transcriptional regulator [Bifidobacterium sp.]